MSEEVASYRRILKTSSIIGGSSVINILIGLARTKVLAMLLGPSGVGLISLYTALMSTASSIASMGIGTVGTRQIAEAHANEDVHALAVVRRSMFWGALLLACAGALVVWSLREFLAVRVLGGIKHADIVGWLALGVAFSVASASQGALIQGMRQIGDIARISVYGSILNTILGIGLLWQWGSVALWAFLLIGPLFNFLLGHLYVSRLPKVQPGKITVQELSRQWKMLLRLGIPFMGAGLANTLVQLWIRMSVSDQLGLDAVGHFQAAWAISMQYIGFVLGAMVADYYPRLTGVINDKVAASRLVNEQTEIALLLSAPVFIAMIGLTPWIVHLLYSPEFAPAIEVLRWQILGDVLKVVSWPLGFVILASGAGKVFFWTETSTLLLMGGLVAGLISSMGLEITGIGFLAAYAYYLPLVYFLAWRRIQFAWSATNIKLLSAAFLICVWIVLLSRQSSLAGEITAIIMASVFSLYTLSRLSRMSNVSGPVRRLGNLGRTLTTKLDFKQ
ncbi:MAG: O-antigen translocase [Methylococcaceae bacterium]|nr:O-antigen translocase [Methylococcaceae bacterium]MDP3902524.1 O-antigen translocase [Methylococcaceae bacterium]